MEGHQQAGEAGPAAATTTTTIFHTNTPQALGDAAPLQGVMMRSTRGTWGQLSPCDVCGQRTFWADSRQCWGCAACFHPPCLGLTDLGSLPFHCPSCQEELQRAGVTDITLDHNVMHTVVRGSAPAVNPDELSRCERVARWFFWDGSNLRLRDPAERMVVPLCRRAAMVSEAARDLGFPGGDRLY